MTEASEWERGATELSAAWARVAGGSLPPHLEVLTERHIYRLETLLETMRNAGIEEDLVRHCVREIIGSYEASLVDALVRLSKEQR